MSKPSQENSSFSGWTGRLDVLVEPALQCARKQKQQAGRQVELFIVPKNEKNGIKLCSE
jgi:hypothetical protein